MDRVEEGIRDNLIDSQDVWSNFCACGFSTFNHTLGELADVTVGRIENDSNDRSGPEYCEQTLSTGRKRINKRRLPHIMTDSNELEDVWMSE